MVAMANEALHLDVKVTEDFILGKINTKGATLPAGAHLF